MGCIYSICFYGLVGVFVMGKCELYHLHGEMKCRDERARVFKCRTFDVDNV